MVFKLKGIQDLPGAVDLWRACPQGYRADFLKPCGQASSAVTELCPTTRCISAQQTPRPHCARTKTRRQASSRPLLLEDTVPSTSRVPLHRDAHIHTRQRTGVRAAKATTHDPDLPLQDTRFHRSTLLLLTNHHKYSSRLSSMPKEAVASPPWRYPKPDCRQSWASCCRRPCWTRGSLEIPTNLTYPTEVLPTQLPALTTCHYSRGTIQAAPPQGTDFFHPAPKAD